MKKVPLNTATFDEIELNEAIAVLRSGQVTMGNKCLQFESDFANYFGVKNAIFVNSGSSANLLAFFALANFKLPLTGGKRRLTPGSEVIVPALTWATTVWPIVQAGGIPVLVDCDPDTLQMKLDEAEAAITPQTVAICPVHILGNAVPMQPVKNLAEAYKLWVIEDTCESLGTRTDNHYVGTLGDMGTFSFFFAHHITTIEGGMITTDDDELADLLRCLRAHGWTRHLKNRSAVEALYPGIDPRFLFINMGFNVRPTEINAAFGIHQLKKLHSFNSQRSKIAQTWLSDFSNLIASGRLSPMRTTPETHNTWFGFPVLCENRSIRNSFQKHLEDRGIETRPIIAGNLARHPAFETIAHRVHGNLRGADQVMDCGIYWSSDPMMSLESIKFVSHQVIEFFAKHPRQ